MFRGVVRNLLHALSKMTDEHVVEINGHKFKFLWRDVVQLGMFIAAIFGIYVTVTGRINDNARNISDLFKRTDITQAQRESMDQNGTRRSHEVDAMQQQMLEAHDRAIREVNEKLNNIMPKVDKIDANVLWLMGRQLEGKK